MSIIDWIVVLVYLALVVSGEVAIKPLTLFLLVIALIIEKIIVERYPFWTRPVS